MVSPVKVKVIPNIELRPIKDWDNYAVSQEGQVWSYRSALFINASLMNIGYLVVNLWKNNKAHKKTVHRLLAEAWLPNPLNLPFVNHLNGIKTDNRLDNYEWCTASENMKHAWKTGLMENSRISGAKLTPKIVVEIRQSSSRGVDLSRQFGISPAIISEIKSGKIWKHVT